MRDFLAFSAAIALIVAVVLAAVLTPAILLSSAECARYERQTGIETDYSIIGGCYVKAGGRWMPYSEYKARAITNEVTP